MFVFSQDLCSLFKTKLTYFVKKIWISSFNIIFLTKCELDLLYKYTVSWIFIFTFDLVYWSCKLNIFLYWKLTSCAWNNKMIGAYYLLLFYTKWYNFIPNGSHWQGSRSDQIRSVAQSCPTLCDPMNCSMPGLPVHHQLPEFTQTQVHRVSDAIQPSHPLLSPSPLSPNPSQHQSLFQWVNSSHEVAKVLESQL